MTRQEFDKFSIRIRSRLVALAGVFVLESGITDMPEDIVQEALMALWHQIGNGYPVQNPDALAVTITKKACLAHLRSVKPASQPIDGIDMAGGTPATSLTDETDIHTIKQSLLDILTPRQRQYLHLRVELGLSLDEMEEVTGCPKVNIKNTISSARRLMAEQLKKIL